MELTDELTEELLSSQADYYRRRASEYDVTCYGDVAAARTRIAGIVAQMQPAGTVLEIACGTGLWTEALARTARMVTAIDVAPEAVAIARDRVRAGNVRFEVADVFSWRAAERFDVIFFCAWLSHVPDSRFEKFWQLLGGLIAEGGRVLFVDEPAELRDKETYLPDGEEIAERQLLDGSRYRIVKNFIVPEQLERRLRGLGWECRTWRYDDSDWVLVCGEAHPLA